MGVPVFVALFAHVSEALHVRHAGYRRFAIRAADCPVDMAKGRSRADPDYDEGRINMFGHLLHSH